MPQETYLEKKLRQLGLSHEGTAGSGGGAKKMQFRLYFPRAPYGTIEYTAAKQGDGLNFVGQLLGHGGSTLKRIQQESGARIEVHDAKGNLNGTYPCYTDPSLHAIVYADGREKLVKAVRLIAEVLAPTNAAFERFEVTPNGSAVLRPKKSSLEKKPSLGRKSDSHKETVKTVWKNHSMSSNSGTGSETKSSGSLSPKSGSGDAGSAASGGSNLKSPQSSVKPWKSLVAKNDGVGGGAKGSATENPSGILENGARGMDDKSKGPTNALALSNSKCPSPVENGVQESSQEHCCSETGNGLQGLRVWDTWGKNHQEPYNQFTAATQSLVTQYANRSRMLKQSQNLQGPGLFSAGANSGARLGGSFFGAGSQGWGPNGLWQEQSNLYGYTEQLSFPDVYSELIGTSNQGGIEESKMCGQYNLNLDKDQKDKVDQFVDMLRVPLPHGN